MASPEQRALIFFFAGTAGTHPVKATGEADVRTLMGSRRTHVQVSWCTIRGSGSCSDLRRRAPIPRQEIADPPVGVVG
jgi:hypothetical protein